MDYVRTPESRFQNLPGYTFPPHYFEKSSSALRMHYLDEGPERAKEVFLCLHGQPTWSYLYRKMIPVFAQHGGRVVAPDFFGFGRSDKPTAEEVYTFDFHRKSLLELISELDLKNITLVCQDWGGIIGLTLPVAMPERFARLIVMNTTFGTGVGIDENQGFLDWRAYSNSRPDMEISKLMKRSVSGLSGDEASAYDAPFPSIEYKAGVRRFPNLVPDHSEAPGVEVSQRAVEFWGEDWRGQSFMAIGMQDPVLGPDTMRVLHSQIANCPAPMEISGAGHFVQEHGEEVAAAALNSFKK